jgi:LCP family protein required for cell wall assembly
MNAKRTVRALVRTLVALTSAVALTATGLAWSLHQRLDAAVTTDVVSRPTSLPPGEAFTALLVGLDARTDAAGNPLPPELLAALHAGPDAGQLHTDTIILLHVPAGAGTPAEAISIPRDSFVPIAGDRGTHKINSAYERGLEDAEEELAARGVTGTELQQRAREAGRQTLVDTVEALTGVGIDHFAEINLAGFVELTDTLGGVPVCLAEPARDDHTGIDLPAGRHVVSGAPALAFVRQRHGLDDGDLDRISRQQAFIVGLAQRLQDAGTLTDPARLQRLVDIVTRHVVLDAGWDPRDALAQVGRLSGADLTFRTIPTGRPDLRTPVDGIAVEVDPEQVRRFVRSVVYGTPLAATPTTVPLPADPTATASATPTPTATPPPTATPTPSTEPTITADGVPCVE